MPRLNVLLLYSPKALKLCCLGRSSDLSLFECLPIRRADSGLRIFKDFGRTYSSGSVQDLHLIPIFITLLQQNRER